MPEASPTVLVLTGTSTLDVRGGSRRRRSGRSGVTVAAFADEWLASLSNLRPRTLEEYERNLRAHVLPRFGGRRVESLDVGDLLSLLKELHASSYTPWTIKTILTPLSRMLRHAVRTGVIDASPMGKLDRWDWPSVRYRAHRILDRDEVAPFLDAAPGPYRTLLATAIFTGLRQNELLGLRWKHIDFQSEVVRVRATLDRHGNDAPLKTEHAVRDVVLIPGLARLLRAHRHLSSYVQPSDFVFPSQVGTALHWRNVTRRGLSVALRDSGLEPLRWHDLRHTYASMLIASGASIPFVSEQMGHADPRITLRVYAHLFDAARYAKGTRRSLEDAYGALL